MRDKNLGLPTTIAAALAAIALPALATGFTVLRLVPANIEQREWLKNACGIAPDTATLVEYAHMDFHDISRVREHCIATERGSYCPTFIFSQTDGQCNVVIYTRGNGITAQFVPGHSLRASPLALQLSAEAAEPYLDLALSPYLFSSPGGVTIVADSPNFVEIISRP